MPKAITKKQQLLQIIKEEIDIFIYEGGSASHDPADKLNLQLMKYLKNLGWRIEPYNKNGKAKIFAPMPNKFSDTLHKGATELSATRVVMRSIAKQYCMDLEKFKTAMNNNDFFSLKLIGQENCNVNQKPIDKISPPSTKPQSNVVSQISKPTDPNNWKAWQEYNKQNKKTSFIKEENMKITKEQLKQIIKEEIQKALSQQQKQLSWREFRMQYPVAWETLPQEITNHYHEVLKIFEDNNDGVELIMKTDKGEFYWNQNVGWTQDGPTMNL